MNRWSGWNQNFQLLGFIYNKYNDGDKMLKKLRTFFISLLSLVFITGFTVASNAKVLVVGQIAEPKSLDPSTVTAVNDFRIVMNIYDGLVRYTDGKLEVEPALAKSWDISSDGTVYTFNLRSGIKFHDGSDFNADAVKFNFDRMLNKDHPYHNTGPFRYLSSFQQSNQLM